MREFSRIDNKSKTPRDIRSIPAFISHLQREGITFEQWEARNASALPDAESESLSLQARHVRLKR